MNGWNSGAFISQKFKENLQNSASTGLICGGTITANATNPTTQVDISEGWAVFTDSYSDVKNPTWGPPKKFGPFIGVDPDFRLTDNFTSMNILPDLTLNQEDIVPNVSEFRTEVFLGAAVHVGGVIINIDNAIRVNIFNLAAQIAALSEAVGTINVGGNNYSSFNNNLQLKRDIGCLRRTGINFEKEPGDDGSLLSPDTLNIAASGGSAIVFSFTWLVGGSTFAPASVFTDTIDPSIYDDFTGTGGATPVAPTGSVATNQWQNIRIHFFPRNLTDVQLGQTLYNSQAGAIASINTEGFIASAQVAEAGILLAVLTIRGGAADIDNIGDAKITKANRFGFIS